MVMPCSFPPFKCVANASTDAYETFQNAFDRVYSTENGHDGREKHCSPYENANGLRNMQ